jgi:hypothetical protein
MPKVVWDDTGKRVLEAGIDRGMLYVSPFAGVAWNGLVEVSESPVGGDAREFFIDGEKYLNLMSPEEFTATVTAFSSPYEFGPCAGFLKLSPGLFTDGQPRKRFGFSYRSLVFNDVLGSGAGYKIHLVYNALARTSAFTHETSGAKPNFDPYSWEIVTTPEILPGASPSAHFVIDSRKTDSGTLAGIENILYGTSLTDPRLLTAQELVMMVGS